ncbi:MAG: kelch repeat-containing protein, partial [Phycisphaerales bacterium]|nr:kelch repeat-containing protein [Phycisphaerales bacterium]
MKWAIAPILGTLTARRRLLWVGTLLLLSIPVFVSLFAQGDTWTAVAPMPAIATQPGGAFINGKLYAFSGGNPNPNSFAPRYGYAYDGSAWSALNPQGTTWTSFNGTASGQAAAIGTNLYLAAPTYDCNSPSPYVFAYDTVGNSFSNAATLPLTRCSIAVAAMGNNLYFVGGWYRVGGEQSLRRVDVYDTVAHTWSSALNLPENIEGAAAAAINGRLYVVGGYNRTIPAMPFSKQLWVYAPPPLNTWTQLPDMPTARYTAMAVPLN